MVSSIPWMAEVGQMSISSLTLTRQSLHPIRILRLILISADPSPILAKRNRPTAHTMCVVKRLPLRTMRLLERMLSRHLPKLHRHLRKNLCRLLPMKLRKRNKMCRIRMFLEQKRICSLTSKCRRATPISLIARTALQTRMLPLNGRSIMIS